jgi:cytochrome P450
MSTPPALRRLIDLPGVSDLEMRALMKPAFADPEARAEFPEIDECTSKLFGLTGDQADAAPRPTDWDNIEDKPIPQQVAAFEAAGWDVTDNKRRPLRTLGHFSAPLWLAIRGVAGELPFQPDSDKPERWVTALASEAARFRKR